jgi:hypothetical protein
MGKVGSEAHQRSDDESHDSNSWEKVEVASDEFNQRLRMHLNCAGWFHDS